LCGLFSLPSLPSAGKRGRCRGKSRGKEFRKCGFVKKYGTAIAAASAAVFRPRKPPSANGKIRVPVWQSVEWRRKA